MAPIVHGLEAKCAGKLDFTYLDIDDTRNDEIKRQFGFRVRPLFILLDAEGNPIQQWVGTVAEDDFIEAFEEALR